MTTVGKILIVLQVVLSLLFMGFAGAVFTVQTKWREVAAQHEDAAKKATNELRNREEEFEKEKTEMVAQLKTQTDRAAQFEAQATGLKQENAAVTGQLASVRTELENAQALAKIAGEEARARRDEAMSLRTANESLHQSRSELIDKVRALSDETFNSSLVQKSLNLKHTELLDKYATLETIARKNGFDLDPKTYEKMQAPPPEVHGFVDSTKKAPRHGTDLVQVTIGSDDGLAKGHLLYVYSTGDRPKYLGKIRVEYLEPDMAVGVVIDKAKNGVIQKGDNVTSKL